MKCCFAVLFLICQACFPVGAAAATVRPYLRPFPVVTVTAGGRAELRLDPFMVKKDPGAPVRYQVLSPRDCQAGIEKNTVIIEPAAAAAGLREIIVIARELPGRPVSASIPVLVLPGEKEILFRVPAVSIGAAPASAVSIAGSFNGWDAAASPLSYDPATGDFTTVLSLSSGSLTYKLVVDGRWMADPTNSRTADDGFGGKNSLLDIGTAGGDLTILPLENQWQRLGGGWTYRASLLVVHEGHSTGNAADAAGGGVTLTGKAPPWIRVWANGRLLKPPSVTTTGLAGGLWRVEITLGNLDGREIPFGMVAALPPGLPYTEYRWTDAPGGGRGGSRVLYFAMIDRFRDGNPGNNGPVIDPELAWMTNFQGGDFAGLKQAIEDGYFKRLGVEWLWISPVNAGPDRDFREALPPFRKFSGYHGYWPVDQERPEPRFGTSGELKTLVATAHRHGLKVMFDAVFNHVHENSPLYRKHPEWFASLILPDGSRNIRRFNSHPLTTRFDDFLPSFDYIANPEAREFMIENALWWIEQTGVDGFRLDAVKHVPRIFWEELRMALKDSHPGFLMIGETISGHQEIKRFIGADCLDGQFDFPLFFTVRNVLALDIGSMKDLENAVRLSENTFSGTNAMSPFLGNHDFARFTAYADGDMNTNEDEQEIGWQRPPTVDHQQAYERLRVAFGLIMALPGYPLIYYGDEYGMSGAGDPDNRRPMRFDDRRSRRERETADFVSRLCRLREKHTALKSGGRLPIMASEDILAFARYDFGDRLIVVLNRGNRTEEVELPVPPGFPANGRYRELVGGRRYRAGKERLPLAFPPRSVSILYPGQ